MKKLVVNTPEACMNCLTCELVCAGAFYKTDNPFEKNLAALRVDSKDGKAKIWTCVQCGKCAKACDAGAITQNKAGVYMIAKDKCKKCGKCAEACPFKMIVLTGPDTVPGKCVACGICVKACPQNVLGIRSDEAA